MKRRKNSDDTETARDYYYKLLMAKKDNEEWSQLIPFDMVPFRADEHVCLFCGNPNMEDSLTGSECKRCGIERLVKISGMPKDEAILEYEYRSQKKKKSQTRYENFVKELVKRNQDPNQDTF